MQAPQVEGYRIERLLGKGGCGAVYLAVQTNLDRRVALKVLPNDHLASPDERRRFRREAKILAAIKHPHLMQVLGHNHQPPTPFIALELCEGGSLRGRLDQAPGHRLPPADVLRLARELLDALATLHDAGVLHRDIKPPNVLFRHGGDALISDLGIARTSSPDVTAMTGTGQLIGTLAYLPPEAYRDNTPTPLWDLFSLGITLHETLAGAHPTGFKPFYLQHPPFAEARTLAPDVPRELGVLIDALTQRDAADRPQSAREALALIAPGWPGHTVKVPVLPEDDFESAPGVVTNPAMGGDTIVGAAARSGANPRPARQSGASGSLARSSGTNPRPARPSGASALPTAVASQSSLSVPIAPSGRSRIVLGAISLLGLALLAWLRPALRAPVTNVASVAPSAAASVSPYALLGLACVMHPQVPVMQLDGTGERRSIADWAGEQGWGWLASSVSAQGHTGLDPAMLERLGRRGIRTLVQVRPDGPPETSKLAARVAALANLKPIAPVVVLQDRWYQGSGRAPEWADMPARVRAWQPWLTQRGLEVAAAPETLLASDLEDGVRVGVSSTGPIDGVVVSALNDGPKLFEKMVRALHTAAGDRLSASRVRWVWMMFYEGELEEAGRETTGLTDAEPATPARLFVMARRHFPQAAVLTDLKILSDDATGALRSTAVANLRTTARLLAGLEYGGTLPGVQRGIGPTFRGGGRTVHALIPERATRGASVTFQAPCPGRLTVLTDSGTPTERDVAAGPVELAIGASAAFFEESPR